MDQVVDRIEATGHVAAVGVDRFRIGALLRIDIP